LFNLSSLAEGIGSDGRETAVGVQASNEIVCDYFRLFVNRRAYTVQATRPGSETGRHYYYRPTEKETGRPLILTYETIRRHLEGQVTIALYAINPSNQCCRWVAIDADYKDALEDLLKLNYYLGRDGVSAALEKSRRGGHLWVFFDSPQPAKSCRTYVFELAIRLGVPVKGNGLPEGIEIFPKHDELRSNSQSAMWSVVLSQAGRSKTWEGTLLSAAIKASHFPGFTRLMGSGSTASTRW
jgi:hypothetical protein